MAVSVDIPIVFQELMTPHRYKILYGGRGSSKSWSVIIHLIMLASSKKMLIMCSRMFQNSIKDSVHRLIAQQIERMGLQRYFTIHQDKITHLNGSQFVFKGIQHSIEEIKSTEGIDIFYLEEAHSITENAWDTITPTIRKDDSEVWAVFNTRFEHDYLYKTFVTDLPPPDSLVIKANYTDNPYFPEVLRKEMENMRATDYDKYLNVYEGELKSLADGAIFGKQITKLKKDKRRLKIPIQSGCEVNTYWDLGKNDETAIWFLQRVGMEYRIIDYYQNRLQDVEHYIKHLKELDYLYGTHFLPHDADHDRLGMTRNIKEQFQDGGINPIKIVPRISAKSSAIELARSVMSLCYFHKADDARGQRVKKGFDMLSKYQYKYNDSDDVFSQAPLHNFASNGADAFQTFAQAKDLELDHISPYDDWNQPVN